MSAVHVDQVLDELTQQRRDRAGISTTSLNVIAFVERDERLLAQIAQRTDQLAERHASRTLLFVGSSAAQSHKVHSRCHEVNDTVLTHSEHIELGAANLSAAELRSIAHALIVPNVRTVLLWGAARVRDPRLAALAELANTVVIFTSASESGIDALREVLEIQGTELGAKIQDLAYLRLFPWQDIVAQFFDDEDLAAELPSISRVEVACGSQPEAYYLVGWLASRLEWEPCGNRQFCNAQGASIAVEMRVEGPARRIHSVCLSSAHSVFGATVESEADDLICLTVEGQKRRPQRCLPLHDVDMISLVERAIFEPPESGVFLETLQMVGRLLEQDAQ